MKLFKFSVLGLSCILATSISAAHSAPKYHHHRHRLKLHDIKALNGKPASVEECKCLTDEVVLEASDAHAHLPDFAISEQCRVTDIKEIRRHPLKGGLTMIEHQAQVHVNNKEVFPVVMVSTMAPSKGDKHGRYAGGVVISPYCTANVSQERIK